MEINGEYARKTGLTGGILFGANAALLAGNDVKLKGNAWLSPNSEVFSKGIVVLRMMMTSYIRGITLLVGRIVL